MYFSSLEAYFKQPRPGWPYRTAQEYGARLAGVIVKYERERKLAEAALGAPVSVIPNGLEIPPYTRIPRTGRLVMGTAVRLSPQKKLEELFAALRLAHSGLPSYVLRIAGGPETGSEAYAASLRALATGLNVDWCGELTGMAEFLQSLDLFVMISEPAGCPNASLEALAAGVPVIATDVGGASEQVLDGLTGRLVPRGDPHALASAIIAASADRAQLARWGRAGHQHARDNFSLARMAEAYTRVLLGFGDVLVGHKAHLATLPDAATT